jgi:ABC-type multidrug transport system fused ATPase/permease subunit
VVLESVNLIRTVKTFSGQPREYKRFAAKVDEAASVGVKKAIRAGVVAGLTWFSIFLSYGVALWFGSWLIRTGQENDFYGRPITGGDVVTTFWSVLIAAMTLGEFGPCFAALRSSQYAATRLFAIIDRVPTIDSTGATRGGGSGVGSASDGRKETPRPQKTVDMPAKIEFKGVQFAYPARDDGDTLVLDGLSMTVEPGTKVALVGASGQGKSTVIALLERFYDVKGGSIEVGGVELADLDLKWWRCSLAVVSQEPALLLGTVMDNIALGMPGVTEKEVHDAAAAANAHDFIMLLPYGYYTFVGEGGALLSGGQKQRIAIARAVLRNPQILLLDEATSALDAHNEAEVQDALDNVMQGRTVVVVAHRLSTVKNADKICVFDGGKVVEQGTHAELLAKGGRYTELADGQFDTDTIATAAAAAAATTGAAKYSTEVAVLDERLPAMPTLKVVEPAGKGTIMLPGDLGGFTPHDSHSTVEPYAASPIKVDANEGNLAVSTQSAVNVNPFLALLDADEAAAKAYPSNRERRSSMYEDGSAPRYDDATVDEGEWFGTAKNAAAAAAVDAAGERAAASLIHYANRTSVASAILGSGDNVPLRRPSSIRSAMNSMHSTTYRNRAASIANRKKNQASMQVNGTPIFSIEGSDEAVPDGMAVFARQSVRTASSLAAGAEAAKVAADAAKLATAAAAAAQALISEPEDPGLFKVLAFIPNAQKYWVIAIIGSICIGAHMPIWSIVFSSMVDVLYDTDPEEQARQSMHLALIFGGLGVVFFIAALAQQWALGVLGERLCAELKKKTFSSILRQEAGWFDWFENNSYTVNQRLNTQTSMVQTATIKPVGFGMQASATLVTGLIIAFSYGKKLALVGMAVIPVLVATALVQYKYILSFSGEEKVAFEYAGVVSANALGNIRAVQACGAEDGFVKAFGEKLLITGKIGRDRALISGACYGIFYMAVCSSYSLCFWYGAVQIKEGNITFADAMVVIFSIVVAAVDVGSACAKLLPGLGAATAAQSRLFQMMNREPAIFEADASLEEVEKARHHLSIERGATKCGRLSQHGGNCKVAPSSYGASFCKLHTCPAPQCDAGKSSAEDNCPAHDDRETGPTTGCTFEAVYGSSFCNKIVVELLEDSFWISHLLALRRNASERML